MPPAQRAPAAVQVMKPPPPRPPAPPPSTGAAPPQQVCPTAPHAAPPAVLHDPFEHVPDVPSPMHADPPAMHMPPTQQPPDWQLFAAQHARPGAPQLLLAPPPAPPGLPLPPRPAPPPVTPPPLHAAPANINAAISAPPRKQSILIFVLFIGNAPGRIGAGARHTSSPRDHW
jgi:hypothetical protein